MSSHRRSKIRFWAYPAAVIALWLAVSAFTLSQLTTVIPSLTPQSPEQPAPEPSEQPVAHVCVDRC
jgi:hypothetical protein